MSNNIHLISAGAGSGKTHTLTEKLFELLSKKDKGIEPSGVIATTFTKLAAGELKERVRGHLIEKGHTDVANQMEQALVGTVNSVCGEVLKRFAFEAGMPPDQQVIDETQGAQLFYQAMEQSLSHDTALTRRMNALCQRLQLVHQRTKQQLWRKEIKTIADAARANNQTADDIRDLGKASADQLLAHFPMATNRQLDDELLGAVTHALSAIDCEHDTTKATREYLEKLRGAQAALIHRRLTWREWISLSKKMPGAKSKSHAQPIADIAADFARNPRLHSDLREFTEQAFAIAADSLDTYQALKTRKGLIDFVDQEQRLYRLLDEPAVAATLREELQLLMVDEFQDTSPIQLALFLKLSELADQVIWVGDIKQSIYGFRGSDPTLMTAVIEQVIKKGNPPQILEKSWRSRSELVHYANNLFVPAFADTLTPEQVHLIPHHPPHPTESAVETWRLQGGKKEVRAQALANGVKMLMASDRLVIDKASRAPRPLEYGDVAILCRTHDNLEAIAGALANARIPISYKRPGLLLTPECSLALACMRCLIDPQDTLAQAEITSLTSCEDPEVWISQRLDYLNEPDNKPRNWPEEAQGPIGAIKAQRDRLPYLTPVEALRLALDAGNVRESVTRWGPTPQRNQHRLNNLAALMSHAEDYLNQCQAQGEPATAAGLVLWLSRLNQSEMDTQASGGNEDAIRLVTHHGAKGLEWPVVIAMDIDTKLRPRLWGLSVIPSSEPMSLDNPLADRTLRYWPRFFDSKSTKIPIVDQIADSVDGQVAKEHEIQESKRLMYVSLTRARDCLVLTMENDKESGEWMDTLGADWMLPTGETLQLPDGTTIPSRALEVEADDAEVAFPDYQPTGFQSTTTGLEKLPLRQSPSSLEASADASIGEIIELGERLNITGKYDPADLGSALHAVIATTLMGQKGTERILADHGMQNTIAAETADACTARLLKTVEERFAPIACYPEFPIKYTNASGQVISGWIDLLLETTEGFVLIDHKASPQARSEWEKIALSYSGQLAAYAESVAQATGKPVLSSWIHFAVTGALIEVRD